MARMFSRSQTSWRGQGMRRCIHRVPHGHITRALLRHETGIHFVRNVLAPQIRGKLRVEQMVFPASGDAQVLPRKALALETDAFEQHA